MRSLRLVALAVLISGCRFEQSIPPSASGISCRSDADCTGGRVCRLDLQLCVVNRDDIVAPFLTSATLSARYLKENAALAVQVEVSEPLIGEPKFYLNTAKHLRPLKLDRDEAPGDLRYSLSTTAQLDDGEGLATVLISMEDLGSNAVIDLTVGTVALDFTAPTLAASAVAIQPKVVRSTQPVSVQLTASEPLAHPSTLLARGGKTSVVTRSEAEVAGGASMGFSVATSALRGEDVVTLTLETLEDLAGNTSAGVPVGTFTIDDVPPTVSEITLTTPAVSHVAGFEVVRFSFTAPLDGRVTILIGGVPVTCTTQAGAYDCSYSPGSSETEGVRGILVQAQDEAGNLTERRASVTYDFTAPSVFDDSTSVVLTPSADNPLLHPIHAGPGAKAEVLFVLSETSLVPKVEAKGLTFKKTLNTGTAWLFSSVVPPSAPQQGAAALTVTAEDLVGNKAVLSLLLPPPGLVIDTIKPDPPSTGPELLFRRIPFGAAETNGVPSSRIRGKPGAVPEQGVVRVFALV